MIKLLNAGFFRLRKSKIFWVTSLIILVFSIVILFNNIANSIKYSLDNVSLNFMIIIGLFISMFTSLFIGQDFAYGTIRNKMIAGHSRVNIYMSNLIISIIASIIFESVYLVSTLGIGILIGLQMQMSVVEYSLILLKCIVVIVAYSSLFNFITLVSSEITIATSICMICFIIMYITCAAIFPTVVANKYMTTTIADENGELRIIEDKENLNPNYPSETERFIAKTVFYILPTGGACSIPDTKNFDNTYFAICSLITIFVTNSLGIVAFKKENLK